MPTGVIGGNGYFASWFVYVPHSKESQSNENNEMVYNSSHYLKKKASVVTLLRGHKHI